MRKSPLSARTREEIKAGRIASKLWANQANKKSVARSEHVVQNSINSGWKEPLPPDPNIVYPDQVRAQQERLDYWFEPITITRAQLLKENTKRFSKVVAAVIGA